jgi:hypothetical protein
VEIDHVLIATRDLAEAARELGARYGLRSVAGGRHPGWGTENRIVPLGEAYLELVAVANLEEAGDTAFGQWVASAGPDLLRPLGWAVRPNDLDDMAGRHGLGVTSGARVTPTGERVAWRTAGVGRAAAEPSLPFFIEWEPGSRFPGSVDSAGARLAGLLLEGDPERVAAWLGRHDVPVEVRPGAPAVVAVTVGTAAGEAVLEAVR